MNYAEIVKSLSGLSPTELISLNREVVSTIKTRHKVENLIGAMNIQVGETYRLKDVGGGIAGHEAKVIEKKRTKFVIKDLVTGKIWHGVGASCLEELPAFASLT